MKVLLTSDWYIPAINGVVTSVLNLLRGLEQMGHEVRVLTLSQTSHSYSREGVTYLGSAPAGVVYPGARFRFAAGEKLVRQLLDWKPDIVHSNCEFSTFQLACRISEELNIPLVHTYHTVYEDYTHYFSPVRTWGRRAVKAFSCRIARRTDCLIVPTEKVKKLLVGYGIEKPVYVIPTGIDEAKFAGEELDTAGTEIREKLGIPRENTVLISVGRLAKEKNCDELLYTLAHFRGKPVTLLIVGDGPCRCGLEELSQALDLGRQVIFTGMVRPEDVGRYYHAGDLFVSASNSETQGLTYLEALASGLPLLCRSDDCLTGVLKNGVNGWQYETTSEFDGRLEWFMEHPESHPWLRLEALETSRKFSSAAFAKCMEEAYAEQICIRQHIFREMMA